MVTFLKSQAASFMGSAVDFLVTILGVELLGWWYVAATVTGSISGGITNFTLGRNWVFQASRNTIPGQLIKYFLVWNGSLALNATGVFALTHYAGISYIVSKLFTSVLVGFSYNYIIQKKYVFK